MRSIVTFTTILGLALVSGQAIAQQKTLKDQLVGHWIFVSSVDTGKDGTQTNRFGPNPKGLAMFDPSGRFSFFISRADIPKFAANSVNQGTAEENKAVMQGTIAFYGTWDVDEPSKTLITKVEAATFPNLNGVTQKRTITSLTADELKYSNPVTSAGTSTNAVWRRAK